MMPYTASVMRLSASGRCTAASISGVAPKKRRSVRVLASLSRVASRARRISWMRWIASSLTARPWLSISVTVKDVGGTAPSRGS